jgi:hypothetical protein
MNTPDVICDIAASRSGGRYPSTGGVDQYTGIAITLHTTPGMYGTDAGIRATAPMTEKTHGSGAKERQAGRAGLFLYGHPMDLGPGRNRILQHREV